jgi:hypothetical protein
MTPPVNESTAAPWRRRCEKPPSGSQRLHEIKLDGFRMAARDATA